MCKAMSSIPNTAKRRKKKGRKKERKRKILYDSICMKYLEYSES
jgi:hypothetical protein